MAIYNRFQLEPPNLNASLERLVFISYCSSQWSSHIFTLRSEGISLVIFHLHFFFFSLGLRLLSLVFKNLFYFIHLFYYYFVRCSLGNGK